MHSVAGMPVCTCKKSSSYSLVVFRWAYSASIDVSGSLMLCVLCIAQLAFSGSASLMLSEVFMAMSDAFVLCLSMFLIWAVHLQGCNSATPGVAGRQSLKMCWESQPT